MRYVDELFLPVKWFNTSILKRYVITFDSHLLCVKRYKSNITQNYYEYYSIPYMELSWPSKIYRNHRLLISVSQNCWDVHTDIFA